MIRTYYLAFGYSEKWYDKFLRGYTHVALIAESHELLIGLEPLHSYCRAEIGSKLRPEEWSALLKITVKHTRANRLIRLQLQTCATFVQYVMGINVGAILAQTLYNRLTTRIYPGVEVELCD